MSTPEGVDMVGFEPTTSGTQSSKRVHGHTNIETVRRADPIPRGAFFDLAETFAL